MNPFPALQRAVTIPALVLALLGALLIAFTPTPAAAAPTYTASAGAQQSNLNVKAADLGQFRPGNIIADSVFFNSGTMNAGQIDSFLRSKVRSCEPGYTCLKDYRQSTPNRAGDKYCNGYRGSSNESAASMIYKVAESCGINPQVFIVMLQKEQGLVTHTWPSSWRYSSAFGMACPDDAPCDPSFQGFFYQLYGAGRQMKIYAENYYFTWFAPGKTWNILYNPSTSCGRSPVYVENTATAALYYYTPYQPNAAALRAGYGEGDGCSAYGNRNFYLYFNDWFGSTQAAAPTPAIAKGSASAEVYLISGGVKHYVTNGADLGLLSSRLGNLNTIAQSRIDSIPTGNRFVRLVRDDRDGGMYLLQPDGSKHRFTTPQSFARFGFAWFDYTSLSADHINAFTTGREVGDYFRSEDSGDYYKWDSGSRRHVVNGAAWAQQRGFAGDYVAVLPAGNAAYPPVGLPLLPSGSLVKEPQSPAVYVTGTGSQIVALSSFSIASDVGVGGFSTVPNGTLSQFQNAGTLGPVISCGGTVSVANGGSMSTVTDTSFSSRAVALPTEICSTFPKGAANTSQIVWMQVSGSPRLYALGGSGARHVRTLEQLRVLAGSSPVVPIRWSTDSLNAFGVGAPYLTEGSFVGFGGPEVYYWSNGVLSHIQSVSAVLSRSGGTWPYVEQLPSDQQSGYPQGAAITN